MFDLKTRMQEQRLSARELARILGIPATTVEAWVYEGAVPKALNLDTINNFIAAVCAHHWVIESSNWPLIEGQCQRRDKKRDFSNSVDTPPSPITQQMRATKEAQ